MGGLFCFLRKLFDSSKTNFFTARNLRQKSGEQFFVPMKRTVDSIGRFELFAGCSRAVFGEQAVHIKSLSVLEFQL
jgi:hypothetical protein